MSNPYPISSTENEKQGPFTLAKNIIKKSGFLVVPFTLPEKLITYWFLARKVHARKNVNLIPFFLVSGAHARLLAAFDHSAQYVAGVPQKVTSM